MGLKKEVMDELSKIKEFYGEDNFSDLIESIKSGHENLQKTMASLKSVQDNLVSKTSRFIQDEQKPFNLGLLSEELSKLLQQAQLETKTLSQSTDRLVQELSKMALIHELTQD